jgi:hypothetical protein
MVVWYWKLVHFDTRLIMVIDSVAELMSLVEEPKSSMMMIWYTTYERW